jgi:hypothetical protein
MPLMTPATPAAAAVAFNSALPRFLANAPGLTYQNYLGTPPYIPTPSQVGPAHNGQQVFLLTLNEAVSNTGSINPPSVGWRFFAGTAPNETVLGRTIQVSPSNEWKLAGVFYGERVYRALTLSTELETFAQAAKEEYELRLLAVPGLNLEVFWLASQTAGSPDLVVPFPQKTDQLILALQNDSYKIATFLALIRPLAAGLLAMAPKAGG